MMKETKYNYLPNVLPDLHCVVKDQEQDFYWVINLEDHPNSFIVDQSFHHLISPIDKEQQDSMVIKQ